MGFSAWRRVRLLATSLVVCAFGAGLVPGLAEASGTLYVTVGGSDQSPSCPQSSPCGSISHALAFASSGDTIDVGPGEFDENVSVPGTLNPVTIQGSGAGITTVRGVLPSDSNPTPGPVFTINQNASATINDLTITGGSATRGGGVFADFGSAVTLERDTVAFNDASDAGGGIYGLATSFTVDHTSVFANHAVNLGGGIYSSSVLGFTIGTITNDAIYANTVTGESGKGAGVVGYTAYLGNDTIAGNQATGASSIGGGVYTNATTALDADTIVDNMAATVGGVNAATFITDTIVAANSGGNCSGLGGFLGGHNLEDDPGGASCGFSAAHHDLVGVNPQLGALALNGGPTKTMALGSGSPAIGAGGCLTLDLDLGSDVDQRGFPRHFATRGVCDIGAYDTGGPAPQTISFTSTPPANPVYGGSYTAAATGGGSGDPVVFTIDSSSDPGACSISGGTVSFTGTGSCVIDANQAGDSNYSAADQVQQTLTIARAPQAISFTSTPPTNPVYGGGYTPAATGGGSDSPVVFSIDSSSDAGACSISGGAVSFTGVGSCVIDANEAGNANYLAAVQRQQTLNIAKAPQAIAFTSSPPTNPVYGGGYTPAATGGGSGDPVVFSIDSSSDAGACSATTGTVSFTGVGSCVIDANQAGNGNYDAAPQMQQTLDIAKATLTVTADHQTKVFGGPVPTLTATLSGFANGETLASSGVTGQANCTTTAIAMSPGGTYPIACAQGTLGAAHYGFSFAGGTLIVTFAETVTGSSSGQLSVASGQSTLIGPGASISGPVTVQAGGALEIDGARINGPLKAAGSAEIRVCNTTITGPTTIAGASGLVTFGEGTAGCPGNKFTGPVRITDNAGGVIFDHNTITGPLTITGNTGTLPAPHTGTVEANANTATGKTDIQHQ